jgi:hypothetical protein
MRLGLAAAVLLGGCSDGQRRDATVEEVRAAAAACGANVRRLHRSADEKKNGRSRRELGMANISVTIETPNDADFSAKANCIDRELNALGAYSNISGPNGEDLLVSSGRDRLL